MVSNDDLIAREFTNCELLKMLSYLEGELQAKDILIAIIKNDKVRDICYKSKYGKLPLESDPYEALRRDSVLAEEKMNESDVRELFDPKYRGIENLMKRQKDYVKKCNNTLNLGNQRAKFLIEELQLQLHNKNAVIQDKENINFQLDEEIVNLKSIIDKRDDDIHNLKDQLQKQTEALEIEKEKAKTIILFLMEERKKLLLVNHELQLKDKMIQGESTSNIQSQIITGLKIELKKVVEDKQKLNAELAQAKSRMNQMNDKLNKQFDELNMLRNETLKQNKWHQDNAIRNNLIYATSIVNTKNGEYVDNKSPIRMLNSNTFPSPTSKESSIPIFSQKSNMLLPTSRMTFTSERRQIRTNPLPNRPAPVSNNNPKKLTAPVSNFMNQVMANKNNTEKSSASDVILQNTIIQSNNSQFPKGSRVPTMPSTNKRSTSLPRTTLQPRNTSLKTLQLFPKLITTTETSPRKGNVSPFL